MPVKIDPSQIRKERRSSTKKQTANTQEDSIPWWNRDIKLFGESIGAGQKNSFYESLHTLLTAGLDIRSSLDLIQGNIKKKGFAAVIENIKNNIISGDSLSGAMQKTKKFSPYEVFSIQIGEESGRLARVLKELSNFFAKTVEYQRQLIGALSYPFFVIGFALLVVFFLLRYLVPMFQDIYNRFDGELPLITQKIIAASSFLQENGVYIFSALGLLVLFCFWQRKTLWWRKFSSFVLLRMPIFGNILHKIYLSRFAQSMHLLLQADVPLMRAVELVEKMIPFYPLNIILQKIQKDILNGKLLQYSLVKEQFFPAQFTALIKVGEEAGKLDEMFAKIAEQYKKETDEQTTLIGSLLEPILIIGLGVLVGFILVGMYLPLFQLGAGIGK